MLVGAVFVADQVDLKTGGDLSVDLGHGLLELGAPVTPVQTGDHGAVRDVEGGEQAGGAMPDVVMGPLLRHAGHHRKSRLGPGQRLALRGSPRAGAGRMEADSGSSVDIKDARVGGARSDSPQVRPAHGDCEIPASGCAELVARFPRASAEGARAGCC